MILCFANFTNAQTPQDYSKLWKEVNDLENEGLPKSALKIVDTIEKEAVESNNSPQQIKALLYRSKYALILEEDAQYNIINDFKVAISNSQSPTKNVLQNVLATLYWQYFNQNRWKFYNRTKTSTKVDEIDFRTWDLQTLFDEIHKYYEQSLANGLILQQTDLKDYEAIIHTQKGSKTLRPTLYDLLAHNALQFYKTNENNITKPAYKFEIDDPKLIQSANLFSRMPIASKDASSLQLKALKIYQSLIKFHLKDNTLEALVDVDIERLNYVYQNATFDNKQELFLNSLNVEREKWSNINAKVVTLYDHEIAKIYQTLGYTYQPKTNETHRWKLKKALEVCDIAISRFPNSKGADKCRILKAQVLSQSLQIISEDVVPIQTNALALIRYKNIDAINFKIGIVSNKELEILRKFNTASEHQKILSKMKVIHSWTSNLKNENDYQQHATEIAIPKLNNGRYIIYGQVEGSANTYMFKELQVSNIAYALKEQKGSATYQVVNRLNGKPIANAQIEYTYRKSYKDVYKTEKHSTNNNGEFTISRKRYTRDHAKLDIKTDADHALFENLYLSRYYNYGDDKPDYPTYKGFLFSDRSIYRPGQPLYFKGIVMRTDESRSEVSANQYVDVFLYNTNGEEVSKLNLKTNAYGSISGEFIIPNDGLTGNFSIRMQGKHDLNTYHSFSVEEYKRPKFEAEFSPVSKTYKVNDTITVDGNAIAYAGSSITDAKVVYRVHRKVQYPRWYYRYRPYFNSEPQEITHGETTTDSNGNFKIDFKAIPDESIDKSALPKFSYEVTADITDINGETRSATTIVNVGYHALIASIGAANHLEKNSKDHKISIDTRNLNGEEVSAKGTIKIYKLLAPETVLRDRPWAAPDYQEFTKDNFKALFPYEAYKNEHDSNQWKKGELVFSDSFDTEASKELKLGKIKRWASGKYAIVLESEDRFGQTVKDEIQTLVYSTKDQTLADNQLFELNTNKTEYAIGDIVELTLGSAASNLNITLEIEKNKKIIRKQVIALSDEKKSITIPVTKEDLGGFVVHYLYVYQNSFRKGTLNISVPYPKTDLEIETLTFRDKLQPGTDETWSFKIKGSKGDKVAAEVLASMYDASLDQFKPHNWSFNPIQQPTYYSRYSITADKNFRTDPFRIENLQYSSANYSVQNYDRLNLFGLDFSSYYYARQRYLRSLKKSIPSTYVGKKSSTVKEGFINGTVTDGEGLPLPGVNVIIKGSSRGVQTDFDGQFSIEAAKGEILVFSFIGLNELKIHLSEDNYYAVTLNEDNALLDEVVISAYSTTKSSNRSVDPVGYEAEELDDSIQLDTLEEQVSGLNVASVSKESGQKNEDQLNFDNVKIRKNLQETAFFFPQLQTNNEGHVSFSFTTPEALTQWKLQLLAHTSTLESTTTSLETVTQKELMVLPNAPRFLRQGDIVYLSTKIANLTDKALSGQAKLKLTDAITNEDITSKVLVLETTSNPSNRKFADEIEDFTVAAKGNTQVTWILSITNDINAVQYEIVAKSGNFSDGELHALPVLTNRMLVTETLPMWIKSNESRTFTLDKLKTSTSTTLKHHKLTLEMTSNPAWYAVQALPYLMEYPYECNEQTFSRYYANALASHIANSNPRIQEVFKQWASLDVLMSNLEKNQELKSLLIQETPWLRNAQSETEQKKRIALLFDLNKMNRELKSAKRKLKNAQLSNGGWAWFKGGDANRYITQHIITGFGHLSKLGVATTEDTKMINSAINYLDIKFIEEYNDIKKYNPNADLSKDHLSYTQLHYLYMRSFYPENKPSKEVQGIMDYYQIQIQKYWLKRSLYAKGLMALVTHRMQDITTSKKILNSLQETSITSEELGMYWKENTSSWYWYQAPIETQALLIEAFSEIENDTKTIDNLKIWLLKNKQTNQWKTTKATTEAVYALLLQGSDWLSVTDMVDVVIGGKEIAPSKLEDVKVEAGTGYYKTSWTGSAINPAMATVQLTKKGDGIAWGSLYWQYFEDLDKITSAETPLKLKKKLFKKTNTDTGETLTEVTSDTHLNVGDLIRVRIELRSDRTMEFVHMKDMRASGLEPINVLSQYKWQDGLGYYESTKDASTNFFFDYLPKGIYVFEYDLRVNNAGDMSNGITTIQSMYAPEFSSHSEGIRISVDTE